MSDERVITVRVDGHGRIVAEGVPPGWTVVPDVSEWTCGHEASAVCAECHRELTAKSNRLAAENMLLIDKATATLEEASVWRRQAEHLVEAAKAVCDCAESDEEDRGIEAVTSDDIKTLKAAIAAFRGRP